MKRKAGRQRQQMAADVVVVVVVVKLGAQPTKTDHFVFLSNPEGAR